jgi:DNA-binding transcriptional MerR regulator
MTIRQLTYWVDHGYVQCENDSGRHLFNAVSLEKISLIKQGLEKGLRLREAAAKAEEFIAHRTQEKAELENLPIEDLRLLTQARLEKLSQFAGFIRYGGATYQATSKGRRRALSGENGPWRYIEFLKAKPYQVYTALQIARHLGQDVEQAEGLLNLLVERHLLNKISYPGADVYRYLPSRRSLA